MRAWFACGGGGLHLENTRGMLRMTTFVAHHIVVSDEETGLLVGFADQADHPGAYLMLQRVATCDDQDQALGMDAVSIERDDQSQSAYGGIEQVTLAPTSVSLLLSAATATALGCDRLLSIAITPSPEELRRLRDGLRQLCGEDVPLVVDAAVDRGL